MYKGAIHIFHRQDKKAIESEGFKEEILSSVSYDISYT